MKARLQALAAWVDRHPGRAATLSGWIMQGTGVATQLITVPLLPYVYGKEGAGSWSFLLMWVAFFQLCDFGMAAATSRQISFSLGERSAIRHRRSSESFFLHIYGDRAVAQLFVDSVRLFRLLSLGIFVAGILFERTFLFRGKMESGLSVHVAWYLIIGMAVSLNAARPYSMVLIGKLQIAWLRVTTGSATLLQNITFIVALWLKAPIWVGAAIFCVGGLLQLLVSRVLFQRRCGIQTAGIRPKKMILRGLWAMSWQHGIASTAAYCIFALNPMFVGYISGKADMFVYATFIRVANLLFSGFGDIMAPQINFMVKLLSDRDYHGLLTKFFKILIAATTLGFIGFGSFAIAGGWVISLWTRGQVVAPPEAIWIMCAYYMVALVQMQCGCFILAAGERRFALIAGAGAVLNFAFAFLFIPRFGITGGMMATGLAELFTSNWYILRLCLRRVQQFAAEGERGMIWRAFLNALAELHLRKAPGVAAT